jgi:hypothetical protein
LKLCRGGGAVRSWCWFSGGLLLALAYGFGLLGWWSGLLGRYGFVLALLGRAS